MGLLSSFYVLFLLTIVWYSLRFTGSDYPFGMFKLFFSLILHYYICTCLHMSEVNIVGGCINYIVVSNTYCVVCLFCVSSFCVPRTSKINFARQNKTA